MRFSASGGSGAENVMEESAMSKYDFEIDLSQNTSTGIILSKIKSGSVVLEFGCATGRMTRYMKEELGCQVFIVEYDADAYETARQYAQDGLCDDILSYRWEERFGGIRFDAILFADVLEHLTAPEEALTRAAGMLKEDGCLFASIPNVTHNDIVLKACQERFDYTPTGLLDDTHVHFWGLKNIEALSGKCGLHIREIAATYCPTGQTEQYGASGRTEKPLLENLLRERTGGEIYQFLVTFDKNPEADTVYSLRTPSIQSSVYLDTGADFNQQERIELEAPCFGEGSYQVHYIISDTAGIKRVRFDPIELQSCILRQVSIRQDGNVLPLICPNAVKLEAGMLLPGKDPMVYTDVLTGTGPIEIQAEILLPGERYLAWVQDTCLRQRDAITDCAVREGDLQNRLASSEGENRQLRGELGEKLARLNSLQETADSLARDKQRLQETADSLTRDKQRLQETADSLARDKQRLQETADSLTLERQRLKTRILGLSDEKKHLQETVQNLTRENGELRIDLGAYIVLANNKDRYALELERELEWTRAEMEHYRGLPVIKIYDFLIRLYVGVKRRVKRLIGKKEQA